MIGYKDILFDLPDTEYAYESDTFADDVEAMRQQQDGEPISAAFSRSSCLGDNAIRVKLAFATLSRSCSSS